MAEVDAPVERLVMRVLYDWAAEAERLGVTFPLTINLYDPGGGRLLDVRLWLDGGNVRIEGGTEDADPVAAAFPMMLTATSPDGWNKRGQTRLDPGAHSPPENDAPH